MVDFLSLIRKVAEVMQPLATRTVKVTGSTQPCISPGSLNRVPASAGEKAGTSPLPGGR